jgi:hypothetical protein
LQFHAHDRGKLSVALLAGVGIAALIGTVEMTGHRHDLGAPPAEIQIRNQPNQKALP